MNTFSMQPRILFLENLNLSDLSKLLNDLMCHDPCWPLVPTSIPLDIPKFKGNIGEDLGYHVTTFDIWCYSNSLSDESIRLRLF